MLTKLAAFLRLPGILALAAFSLAFSGDSFASSVSEQLVYGFLGSPDGIFPSAGLVADRAGNLYGTTNAGGTAPQCSCGTVFELSPPAQGGPWTETILYSFQGGDNDGERPNSALIFDQQGNLYGTTLSGGSNASGTIFELIPPASGGAWTEKVLWIFPADFSQGGDPLGALVLDSAGNLYGTAASGGTVAFCGRTAEACGVVFELIAPAQAGEAWTEEVLYNFGSVPRDGFDPWSNLIFYDGALYGTTAGGGTYGFGTVFLVANRGGAWRENILYNFTGGSDGGNPYAGLIADRAGNLYGTAEVGGNAAPDCDYLGCGVIFELSSPDLAGNLWTETTIYAFLGKNDGANPLAALYRDMRGNLYGTASQGGEKSTTGNSRNGTAFELRQPAATGGAWTFAVLHDFGGFPSNDGSDPTAELIELNGVLYGTTYLDGNQFSNGGVVFSIVP